MHLTRPPDFNTRSSRAGDLERDVAIMAPTSEVGNESKWDVMANPRPREQPVIRYEAI
jgi:hypothetical protein